MHAASLAEAQEELARSLAEEGRYSLRRAPADGACFFHSLRMGGATDLSVEELRERLGCPWPGEAEEEHVIRAVRTLHLRLVVVPWGLCFPWQSEIAFQFPSAVLKFLQSSVRESYSSV